MIHAERTSFAELRHLLKRLGFQERRVDGTWVFQQPREVLIAVRPYGDDDPVDEGDVRSTRRFLDMRGPMDGDVFDAAVKHRTPA